MNKKVFYFIFLVFNSCATKNTDSELYGKCKTPMYGCTQLKLNKNHTFEYFVFEDVGGGNLRKGNWKIHNGDTLVFNTFEQPNKDEIESDKMIYSYTNPKYLTNKLIVLKKHKVIIIPEYKNVKIFSLKKTKLEEKKWQ